MSNLEAKYPVFESIEQMLSPEALSKSLSQPITRVDIQPINEHSGPSAAARLRDEAPRRDSAVDRGACRRIPRSGIIGRPRSRSWLRDARPTARISPPPAHSTSTEVSTTSLTAPSQPRHRDYVLVVLIALASRALTLFVAAAARFGSAPDGRLGSTDLSSLLVNWDSGWYLRIIRTGYATLDLPGDVAGAMPHAYFPVFPLAVRAFAAATALDPVTAGVLLASLLFVGSCAEPLIWKSKRHSLKEHPLFLARY